MFIRGDVRHVRIRGLSFRVDCLQYVDVDDLTKLTTHDLGHGMLALLDCERRCVIYRGRVDVSPILERVVFAVTCAKGGERRFVCSTARGLSNFQFPGPGVLPEVWEERLRLAKNKDYHKICRVCHDLREGVEDVECRAL